MRFASCRRFTDLDMLDLKIEAAFFSESSLYIHKSIMSHIPGDWRLKYKQRVSDFYWVFVGGPVITRLSIRSVAEKCQQNFLRHPHTHVRLQNRDTQIIESRC